MSRRAPISMRDLRSTNVTYIDSWANLRSPSGISAFFFASGSIRNGDRHPLGWLGSLRIDSRRSRTEFLILAMGNRLIGPFSELDWDLCSVLGFGIDHEWCQASPELVRILTEWFYASLNRIRDSGGRIFSWDCCDSHNILLNSTDDRLQNSKEDWCQNAVGFAAPCPAGAGSSMSSCSLWFVATPLNSKRALRSSVGSVLQFCQK